MKYSFRTKILIIIIATIFIPTVIVSIFIMNNLNAYYEAKLNPAMETKLAHDLNRMETFFSESESELGLYTKILGLKDNETYIYKALDRFLDSNTGFINAYYATKHGDNYVDNRRVNQVDGRDRDWFLIARDNGFSISEPYIDALTKEWVVTLSSPVYKNNEFYGVMGVDYLIDDLVQNIANTNQLSETWIVVKDKEENIIYYNDHFDNEAEADESLAITNKNEIVKVYPLDKLHIDLYIVYSVKAYNEKVEQLGFEMAAILFFIIVFSLVLALSSSKKIAMPLDEFKEAIAHVSETHLPYVQGLNTNEWSDEFKNLFDQFRNLVKTYEDDKLRLTKKIDMLQRTNQDLMEVNLKLENMYKKQKKLDRMVRQSQEEFFSILNNINGMVWVLDANGDIVFVNEGLELILGYEQDEIKGAHIHEIVQNKYATSFQFFDMIKDRIFTKLELNLISSDYEMILTEASIAHVYHNDELLYIYGICRDVRENKNLHYAYNMKIQEQNLIMDLTETASMNMAFNQVIESVFDKLNVVFGWSTASIRFLNDQNEFELLSHKSKGSEFMELSIVPFENSCLGYTIEKNEIFYVSDIDGLPYNEQPYNSMLEMGYAVVFIPFGQYDIGQGVISIAVEKSALFEKEEMLKAFCNTIMLVVERALIYEKLKKDYIRMIKVLAESGDDKDFHSAGHSNRVADICKKIGEQMYLDDDEIIDLEVCGLLHDIGKIGISDEYLSSSNPEAIEKVKEHPIIGKNMLVDIGLSDSILEGILYHHVNFDFSGYPVFENVETLPLFARIVRVADAFDNLYTEDTLNNTQSVLNHMISDSGTKYCPNVMRVLKDVIDKNLI